MTKFTKIYNCFLGKITDDMYLEWTKKDTLEDLQGILLDAIPNFEFPHFQLYNYQVSDLVIVEDSDGSLTYEDSSAFENDLTQEEINILAVLMVNTWIQRQLTSVENIRMKYYSTADFKMTSQANHLSKLILLKNETEKQSRHIQRLYGRRRTDSNGGVSSNWSVFREDSVFT